MEQNASWFERLPKVELHLHLEGAIPHEALWALIRKYGGDKEVPTLESLVEKFRFKDFASFIDTWLWKSQFLREYEDFTFVAEAFARALVAQNIKYAEVHYVPGEHCEKGRHIARFPKNLDEARITEAFREGLDKVLGVEVALIVDLCRDIGPRGAEETLSRVQDLKELGVVGVGLGGSEQRHPPELFSKVFARAQNLGFHTTAHAGEVAGPESIWSALRSLNVKRIGHGTTAIFDPKLIDHLRDNNIVLEMCPLSNCRTKVVQNLKQHPIREFFDNGLLVTVNTDDPEMFNNPMSLELQSLQEAHGFSYGEICQLMENAVSGSWLEPGRKSTLLESLRSHPDWVSAS